VTTLILLARHGETDWNRERRVQGHTDVPLNSAGRRQAQDLAEVLSGDAIDSVYSSDLRRASATAGVVADPRGLEVVLLTDLRERNFGTWEGLTDDEARRRYPEETSDPRTWGDGETQVEMAARVLEAVRLIGSRHSGEVVLVVSHGGPLRAVLRLVGREVDGPLENCAVVRLLAVGSVLRGVD